MLPLPALIRRLLVLGVAASALLVTQGASSAHAQPGPSASETALAREQYRDGMTHAEAGRWPAAYAAFSRAYSLVRRPLVLLNLAGAEEQIGRLVESAEHYRQFLREVTTGREAQQRSVAEQGLARVEPRIPRARFMLAAARNTDTYLLDDAALATAAMGTALPLDPGAHTLVVTNAEREIGRVSFTLREGETKDVLVTVTRPTTAAVVGPQTPPTLPRVGPTGPRRVDILPRNGEEPPPSRSRTEESGSVFASRQARAVLR